MRAPNLSLINKTTRRDSGARRKLEIDYTPNQKKVNAHLVVLTSAATAEATVPDTDQLPEVDTQREHTQWIETDPLLEPRKQSPAANISDCAAASKFSQLQPCQDSIDMQQQHALLAQGMDCISKLSDFKYTAATEYSMETDAAWSARMVAAAPSPDWDSGTQFWVPITSVRLGE